MTENDQEILFMTVNDPNNPFSIATHEVIEQDFLKQYHPINLNYHPEAVFLVMCDPSMNEL